MTLPTGTPAIITITALAARLGLSRSTVLGWVTSDIKWRGCIARSSKRKNWLSVQRLIDNGILPRPDRAPIEVFDGPAFTYRTVVVA